MSNISSLSNVHKIGLFGDYQNKNENNLIKIKEIKNINLYQVVKYKSSQINSSNIQIDGLNLSQSLKTTSNSSTRIIWMGPENWFIFSIKNISEDLKKFKDSFDFSLECAGSVQAMEFSFSIISNTGTCLIIGNDHFDMNIKINPFDLIKGKKIFGFISI